MCAKEACDNQQVKVLADATDLARTSYETRRGNRAIDLAEPEEKSGQAVMLAREGIELRHSDECGSRGRMKTRRQHRVFTIKVPNTDSTGVPDHGMFARLSQELGRSFSNRRGTECLCSFSQQSPQRRATSCVEEEVRWVRSSVISSSQPETRKGNG